MSYSSDRISWPSEQPLRARFQPKINGLAAAINDPVLYLSRGPLVPLAERHEITEQGGSGSMTVDAPYIEVIADEELREEVAWYRLDMTTDDGPRTFAAGTIDRVEV